MIQTASMQHLEVIADTDHNLTGLSDNDSP